MIDIFEVPDWVSPPGETILDILEERGWTQAELAERTGFTRKHVNQLIKGKASITEETALRLERVLGSTAGFWLKREAQYRETSARQSELNDLKSDVGWLSQLPIADMVRFGWIKRHNERVRQVAECLRYFGVASVVAWKDKYEAMVLAFRASEKFERKQGAVTAWIRNGEREAEGIDCAVYQRVILESNLPGIRSLMTESDPAVFLPKLKEFCRESGIVLVIAPSPKGCPVSGITKWLQPDKALVMLSLRYKSNDHFWFTFFHELAHLILHGKKMMFLELHDGLDNKSEDEANRWAANFLIPLAYEKQLRKLELSEARILQFAEDVGIPPGIVVGRLQKDNLIPWNSSLNALKVFYRWDEDEE